MNEILEKAQMCTWPFWGCTVIEETYSFVLYAMTCLSFLSFNFLLKCLLKVWVLAHNYYAKLMTKEIPSNSAFANRLKSQGSGLEVEAKLNFQY